MFALVLIGSFAIGLYLALGLVKLIGALFGSVFKVLGWFSNNDVTIWGTLIALILYVVGFVFLLNWIWGWYWWNILVAIAMVVVLCLMIDL